MRWQFCPTPTPMEDLLMVLMVGQDVSPKRKRNESGVCVSECVSEKERCVFGQAQHLRPMGGAAGQ